MWEYVNIMKILKTTTYRKMINVIKQQDDELKRAFKLLHEGLEIMAKLKAENDYLRALNNVSDIDFPNTEEGSKTNTGNIDINDIFNN